MKNITGGTARKENFYPRKHEVRYIEKFLGVGANMQIIAPRRTGKTSILYHFMDYPIPNYCFIILDVEEVRSANEYYRRIFTELLNDPNIERMTGLSQRFKTKANLFLKEIKSVKLSQASIEINEQHNNFKDDLINLIRGIDTEGLWIVVMVDEFPEVILNLIKAHDGVTDEAINFLQSNRALRNDNKVQGKIQFIYTGSNSLNKVASQLQATQFINDLQSVPVQELSEPDAKDFIIQLLSPSKNVADSAIDYLIRKIGWRMPFFIQLICSPLLMSDAADLTEHDVDAAFEEITESNNRQAYDHYITRLGTLYKGKELQFVKAILAKAALSEQPIPMVEIEKTAAAYKIDKGLNEYISDLQSDGYIVKSADREIRFYSPILKHYWKKHEC